MARVDFIINPRAGRLRQGRPGGRREALISLARRCGAHVHEPETLADLDAVAGDLARAASDAVVFAGGDGSLMRGLTALARAIGPDAMPLVGLVPAGTVGTIARHLGLQRVAPAAVLEAAASGGPFAEAATLRVTDERAAAHVGFIFGAGLVGRFFDVYHASKRQGLATAAWIAARVFAGSFVGSELATKVLGATACTLRVDGATIPCAAFSLIVASVVRDLGLHFHVTYRAGEDPARFHVVASGLPPAALGPQMPRVVLGRPLRGSPHVDTLAASMRLAFQGEGTYVVDGDVFRAASVTVEGGPRVRFLLARSPPAPARRE